MFSLAATANWGHTYCNLFTRCSFWLHCKVFITLFSTAAVLQPVHRNTGCSTCAVLQHVFRMSNCNCTATTCSPDVQFGLTATCFHRTVQFWLYCNLSNRCSPWLYGTLLNTGCSCWLSATRLPLLHCSLVYPMFTLAVLQPVHP
jgi:hypothetical protein